MGGNITWSKLGQSILPIILTALIGIIGFLVVQIIQLRSENGNIKECVAMNYGKVSEQMGRQEVTVKNLSTKIDLLTAKIDSITVTRIRGDGE